MTIVSLLKQKIKLYSLLLILPGLLSIASCQRLSQPVMLAGPAQQEWSFDNMAVAWQEVPRSVLTRGSISKSASISQLSPPRNDILSRLKKSSVPDRWQYSIANCSWKSTYLVSTNLLQEAINKRV